MGASVALVPSSISVEPGGEATCEVRLRNTGTIVDQFTFEVLGDAAGWAAPEPATLSLFPGAEGTVQVRFRPPRRPSTPAGAVPFGLRVVSKEDPAASRVEEGLVQVGGYHEGTAELTPRTSRGRLSGRHELSFENAGNLRANVALTASDPDEQLAFDLRPPAIVSEPGAAAFSRVTVKPRKRFLRGPSKTLPFQVTVEPEGSPPFPVGGSMLQEALIPSWVPKALLALAALVVLWFAFLRPQIESTAKNAVEEPLQQAEEQIQELAEAVGAPAPPPLVEPPDGGEPTEPPDGNGGAGSARRGPQVDGRLTVGGTSSFAVPEGQTLYVTDLVLGNPNGDSGTLQVRRDDAPLLVVRLENFRDLDYHFVTPLVFGAGQRLVLGVNCQAPGLGADDCSAALYYSGFLRTATAP